ncbi:MAG: hypothetical protein N3A72_07355 [bacterium]|nr:hypothetical protein [bacterium]
MKFKVGLLSLLFLIITISAFAGIPAEIKLQSWIKTKKPVVYSREKLTDHINGAAEIYYTYAVKDVTVYEFEQNKRETISVDIYDMSTPDDAFGIYSFNRFGSNEFVDVGNEGIIAPGLLDFWVAQYYVRISAGLDSKISTTDLIRVGKQIAKFLTSSTSSEPRLVKILPKQGLIPSSIVYFHEKLILNNVCPEVNKYIDLKLTEKTNAVYAEYEFNKIIGKVIIVEYQNQDEVRQAFLTQKETDPIRFGLFDNYIILFLNFQKDNEVKLADEIYKRVKSGEEDKSNRNEKS